MLALPILLPLLGAFICFVCNRAARWIAVVTCLALLLALLDLASSVDGNTLSQFAGGWTPPLGIGLYADGLSVLLLCLTAIVGLAISIYATAYFEHHADNAAARVFWPLWLLLLGGINALFLTADVFNLYVTLELMGLVAVALVTLEAKAIAAALRYLLVGLLGSMLYLLGVGLLYAQYATVDMQLLAQLIVSDHPVTQSAVALMSAGLIMKAALFPLHFWLPPAHASAPAPVSAALSALVVKAAFYAVARLWIGPFAEVISAQAGLLLALLGAAAILWGSLQALLAARLKLVVAYSTVAQLGYLFLMFAFIGHGEALRIAWYGGIWLALSHGLAKAGLFLAAGSLMHASGHDRVSDLAGAGQHLPITLFAIGLASASLMGLPPSGGFIGKWFLLNAAFTSGQWWWALVLLGGGVLTAAYTFRVLLHAFRNRDGAHHYHPAPALMEWSALALALGAVALGIWSAVPLGVLESGAPLGPFLLSQGAP